jgi:hypothetical protein
MALLPVNLYFVFSGCLSRPTSHAAAGLPATGLPRNHGRLSSCRRRPAAAYLATSSVSSRLSKALQCWLPTALDAGEPRRGGGVGGGRDSELVEEPSPPMRRLTCKPTRWLRVRHRRMRREDKMCEVVEEWGGGRRLPLLANSGRSEVEIRSTSRTCRA